LQFATANSTSQKLQKSMPLPTLASLRKRSTKTQQSIKIIAEIVVNMNIVVRNNFSSKLKNSTSEIGYYSYTNRYLQAEKRPVTIIKLLHL